ncbi:hypothetical protein Tco_0407293 [Tanacetum coccineum]
MQISDMALPPHEIHMREVNGVSVFDFEGLSDLMAEGLTARITMEHCDEASISVFTSRAWRRMFDIRGPLVHELILEFFSTFRFGQAILDMDTLGTLHARQIPDKGDLRDYWMGISSTRDFLGTAPSYTAIRDPILRLCHRLIACSIAGRIHAPEKMTVVAAGRKSGAHISGGQFVARLVDHFGLLTAEILGGLTVVALKHPVIDMAELVRLQISVELDDTWAWVAMGPERQPDAAAGSPTNAEDAPIIDKGGQANPTLVTVP